LVDAPVCGEAELRERNAAKLPARIAPDSPFFSSAYSSFSIFEGLVGSALVSEFLAIKIAARHVWWGEREHSCHILW